MVSFLKIFLILTINAIAYVLKFSIGSFYILNQIHFFLQFDTKHNLMENIILPVTVGKSSIIQTRVEALEDNKSSFKRIDTIATCSFAALSLALSNDVIRKSFNIYTNTSIFLGTMVAAGTLTYRGHLKKKSDSIIKNKNDCRCKVKEIIEEAQHAHNSLDYGKFLEILSKNYDDGLSIIPYSFKMFIDIEGKEEIGFDCWEHIEPKNIILLLLDIGYSPDFIAYFLMQIWEALVGYFVYLKPYIASKLYFVKCQFQCEFFPLSEEILLENSRLIKESKYLDDKLNNLKNNNTFNKLCHLISKSNDDQVTFYMSKFNEIRNTTIIYDMLFHLFLTSETCEISTIHRLKYLKRNIIFDYKYITENDLCFEVMQDFLWLFARNNELTDAIFN
jgi:hypothetical protein